ncbi:MAG: O-antigen ligase family protein [Actinomycetota bacterium]|nr:O-antigen ligase family protein [Actinomycetota bacterium]
MTVLAAVTGPLPKLGVVVVALLAAAALLAREPRARALATLGALALSPVLLLTEIWSSPQLHVVHSHPLYVVVGGLLALGLLGLAARQLATRFYLVGPLAVLALPFRIPIQAGGGTSNLLVPLYLVVAAGALAWVGPALLGRGDDPPEAEPSSGWALRAERLLALYVVLYAVQAIYSPSFEKALQNMVFFYVPFTLLYCLLRGLRWTPAMVRNCLLVVVALALVFALIAYVEYATKTIILNPKLVVTNDLHTYFTVNSVFFDPDIFGRFLALVMILVAVLLLYPRPGREQAVSVVVLAALWVALVLTLSRSSLGALLVGLGVLAALRWKPTRALVVAAVVIAVGAVAVVALPRTFGLNQGFNGASSGRGGLISGGISLFGDRPLWGYGSGSFVQEYRAHRKATATTLSASHTIPVTVAAEQGVIGELVYAAFVVCALICLLGRTRGDPLRGALAAAFAAVVFHTMLYADFLEDPITWALLSVGVALAVTAPRTVAAEAPALRLSPASQGARA